jgi:hypothetical protein
MSREMPLLAELTNCLSAYHETFQRIMTYFSHAGDTSQKKHDSPVIIQVQDLLSIDAELKRHVQRMDAWAERQAHIDELERELAGLSSRVNEFARSLSSTQIALQNCVAVASKLQKGVLDSKRVSVSDIIDTARAIGPAASGARRGAAYFPWMPDSDQMKRGVLVPESADAAVPSVSSMSVPMEPVQTTRLPVLPEDMSTSSDE